MAFIPPKIYHWIKVFSKFASVQILVQIFSLVSSIFLVRILKQEEYGYYTIATSIQGTIPLLADMGISTAMSAIGGGVWQDRHRFGQLINTALQIRFVLAVISFAIFIPILCWMLIKNGASITNTIAIVICVAIGCSFKITTEILIHVPRLKSQIDRVQNLDLIFAITRMVMLGISSLTIINAAIATGAASVAYGLQRLMLGRWVDRSIDLQAPINIEDREQIIEIIKQSAPNAIYYCFQGQITIGLITMFGNVQNIAAIGALERLGVIFSVISSVLIGIVMPSFSRCRSPKLLVRRYWQIMGVVCLLSIFLFSIVLGFPSQLLWIIGSKYTNFEQELYYVMLSSLLFFIVNTMWSINSTKAWIDKVWLQIPGTLICQVLSMLWLDLSTLKGAICFGMAPLLPGLILNAYMTYQGFQQEFKQI
jgi:O-antigen/teichoic acid export membrane protein